MKRHTVSILAGTTALLLLGQEPKPATETARARTEATAPTGDILLWKDPGAVETLDFAAGPGGPDGAPLPPFVFQEEDKGGSSAKILLTDGARRTWSVKWGEEVRSEPFAARLLGAVGYFVEPAYYVGHGRIQSVGALTRAAAHINRSDGNSFQNARFELRDPKVRPIVGRNWTFVDPGLVASPQFSGLKIMMMLLSNWDVKDARSSDGPNTAVMEIRKDDGTTELWYAVTDWGATMGRWGGIASRSKWNCSGFADESKDFVKGVAKSGMVGFGFKGKRQDDITHDIPVAHVQWLMGYLGRVTDDQLRAGLRASGANSSDTECFTKALRQRIDKLQQVASR